MPNPYWHKQTPDKPLSPDLLWSRPEHRAQAGKLLIVGGNAHGFSAAAEAYTESEAAGIGTARVLLPDSLQKTVGRVFEAGEYAPSTPSGSFSQTALAELLGLAAWSDGALVAGDLGKNSETAMLLEQFAQKYRGPLTVTQDALDYFTNRPTPLLARPDTLLVPSFAQLQKLATAAHFATTFTASMDFLRLIDALHDFTTKHPVALIVNHLDTAFVALKGQVSTTKPAATNDQIKTAAHASVWWLQTPIKPFEALSSSQISPTEQQA